MKEERLISTKDEAYTYPYPTMDMYVHGLKNSLDQEGDGGKRLEGWLQTITLMPQEKHRNIKARLDTNYGRGAIYQLDSGHEIPATVDENTQVSTILEINGLLRAKLELIKGMDNVPWTVRLDADKKNKEAEKEAKLILGKSHSKQLPGRQSYLFDIFKGVDFSKRKLLTTTLPTVALYLAACSPVIAKPVEVIPPTEKPVSSATIDKPTQTKEPTKKPTRTPEPSLTPELFTGDPNVVESWPEKYQNFFINHPENQAMDQEFQQFLNTIRINYLKMRGVENAEQLAGNELIMKMFEEVAKDKAKTILSPKEIADIQSDPNIAIPYWISEGKPPYESSGIWASVGQSEFFLEHALNFKFTDRDVYGRDIIIHRYPADQVGGRMLGFFRLPGKDNFNGFASTIETQDGEIHILLYAYREIGESNIDESNTYCYREDGRYGMDKVKCIPEEDLISPKSRGYRLFFSVVGPQIDKESKFFEFEEDAEMFDNWYGNKVSLGSVGYLPKNDNQWWYAIDKNSGLELLQDLRTKPHE